MMFLKALPQNWYLSLFTYIHCPKQVISPCPVAMDGVGFSAESERQFRDSWQRAWMHDSFKGGSGVLGKIILCTVLKFWSLGQLRNLLNSTHQWMFETGVCYLSYVTEMASCLPKMYGFPSREWCFCWEADTWQEIHYLGSFASRYSHVTTFHQWNMSDNMCHFYFDVLECAFLFH